MRIPEFFKYQKRKYLNFTVFAAWFAMAFMIFETLCIAMVPSTVWMVDFHFVCFVIQSACFMFQLHLMRTYSRISCQYE